MSAARRILLPLPIVIALPVAQAALVLPEATPGADPGFLLLALFSFAAAVLAAWLLAAAVLAGAEASPWRPRLRSLLWTGLFGVIVAGCAVLNPVLALPALVLAALVLPGPAAGESIGTGLRAFRRQPGRGAVVAVASLLLFLLAWLIALLVGLFVTGALAALLCWSTFAVAGAVALGGGTNLVRRR